MVVSGSCAGTLSDMAAARAWAVAGADSTTKGTGGTAASAALSGLGKLTLILVYFSVFLFQTPLY